MQALSGVTTFLFTDIEGSSRLWEHDSMKFGAILEIVLLVFALVYEYGRYVARRKAERLAAVGPSASASAAA